MTMAKGMNRKGTVKYDFVKLQNTSQTDVGFIYLS